MPKVNWVQVLQNSHVVWGGRFKHPQNTAYNYYKGKHFAPIGSRRQSIDNIFLKSVLAEHNNLIFKTPKYEVSPIRGVLSTKESLQSAKVIDVYLTYLLRTLDAANEVSKTTLEALLSPMGFIEVNSSGVYSLKLDSRVEDDVPFISYRSPDNVRFDVSVRDYDLHTQRWVALKDLIPKKVILESDQYEKPEGPNLPEVLSVWNVWDRFSKKIFSIFDNKVIRVRPWPVKFRHFPLISLWFYDNPQVIFPMTYLDTMKGSQDGVNRVLTAIINHVEDKTSNQWETVAKDIIDDQELIALKTNINGARIKVKRRGTITRLDKGQIQSDLFKAYQTFRDAEIEHIKSENVEDNPSKERKIKRFYRDIGDNLLEITRQTFTVVDKKIPLSPEEFVTAKKTSPGHLSFVLGADNVKTLEPWLNVKKSDIRSRYYLSPTSTLFQTTKEKLERTLNLYKLVKDNSNVKQSVLLRKVFEDFGLSDSEQYLFTEEEVTQRSQQASQSQVRSFQEVDKLKRQTDLAKTILKERSKDEIATMTVKADLLKTLILKRGEKNGP